MFDVRSLFVVMVATNVVLAASFWIGTGRRPRGGLGAWTLALVVQAAAFLLFAAKDALPTWATIVTANGLIGFSFSLIAAALLEFRGSSLPRLVHPMAAAVPAFAVAALIHDLGARLVVANFLFAAASAAIVALAWKKVDGVSGGTRGLFLGGFALGAAGFVSRGIGPLVGPLSPEGFFAPTPWQAVSLMVNYSVILIASVSYLLMQKERADHLVQQQASLDPLTHTFNRRTLNDLARKQLARARRLGAPLSLVLLDIDHFKQVNDTHGHLAGDRVLVKFAQVVRDQLREEDVLARYGGEEFCLLLPDVPGPGAVALAGRIRKAVAKESFAVDGKAIALTLSAGVAARIDEGPDELDDLVARADEALYIAKNRGRNRVAAVSLGRSRAA